MFSVVGEMTQTQERKLYRDLTLGKEDTVCWNTLLQTFSELPDARQVAALKKISINSLSTLIHNVSTVKDLREPEFLAEKEKLDNLKQIKELLESTGVGIDDLNAYISKSAHCPVPRSNSKRGSSRKYRSVTERFKRLESVANNSGFVRLTSEEYMDLFDLETTKAVTQLMYSFKKEHLLTGSLKTGYTIIQNSDNE